MCISCHEVFRDINDDGFVDGNISVEDAYDH